MKRSMMTLLVITASSAFGMGQDNELPMGHSCVIVGLSECSDSDSEVNSAAIIDQTYKAKLNARKLQALKIKNSIRLQKSVVTLLPHPLNTSSEIEKPETAKEKILKYADLLSSFEKLEDSQKDTKEERVRAMEVSAALLMLEYLRKNDVSDTHLLGLGKFIIENSKL